MHDLTAAFIIATGRRPADDAAMHIAATAGGQGAIEPKDVVEAVLFCFRLSPNAVPEEIVLKALKPGTDSA